MTIEERIKYHHGSKKYCKIKRQVGNDVFQSINGYILDYSVGTNNDHGYNYYIYNLKMPALLDGKIIRGINAKQEHNKAFGSGTLNRFIFKIEEI